MIENKTKRKMKSTYYIFWMIGVLLIIFGIYIYGNDNSILSKMPSLKDDFYGSINYLNKQDPFYKAQTEVSQNVTKLVTEIENDPNYKDDDYFNFFETYEDYDGRDQNGISELEPYFKEIDAATNLDEFSNVLAKIDYDLGIDPFVNIGMMPDLYDNSKNLLAFSPISLETLDLFLFDTSMPSGLEFFTNEKYSTYKEIFEKTRIEFLKVYGYEEEKAKEVSDQITEYAKKIQAGSLSIDELNANYMDYYKKYSLTELKEIVPNLPIEKILNKYGLGNYNEFVVIDDGHLRELDSNYNEANLPVMKEILKVLILENIASLYSSSEYAEVFASCYTALSGEKVSIDLIYQYNELIELKPKMMGKYLNEKYDEKYFTKEEKQEIIDLINKIKNHYREVINNSTWLSDSTKVEAIKKLDNMKINVGYVATNEDQVSVKLLGKKEGGTLLKNYILIHQDASSKMPKYMSEKYTYSMDQFEVNAGYYSLENSINIPSAFREIYRNITDKSEIYGYIGTIIAHEITHAFDNNGSKYDEYGNLKDWWTSEDRSKYDELKQKIVDYYSNYEVYGMKVNGENTVGENISDLASINTMVSIMESENATDEEYKKFFKSFAKLWAEETTKDAIEMQILSDVHSPNSVRVNAVLSSTDKFYEVYGIEEKDKMYVAKEDRVGLW